MKRGIKAIALILGIVMLLTGCGSFFNASAYVQASLDASYKGDFSRYKQLVNITEDQMQADYEAGYQSEADVFAQHFGVKTLTDNSLDKLANLYKTLYENVSYEVGESKNDKDGFAVDVKIKPITIFKDNLAGIDAAVQQFNEQNLAGAYVNLTTEQFEDTYVQMILDVVSPSLENIPYGNEKTLTLNLYKAENRIYYIDENDLSAMKKAVIVYA